ncbi:P-selectin-like [Styela clava]|uniref:P-selectin-like n=1 Tax=Styela clava TaxID=7725 RepID=UPI0019398E4F|nr:P-selectin-like [Styela clava]
MDAKKFFILIACCFAATSEALRCISCDNAQSHDDCKTNGKIVTCQENEQSCHAQVRIHSGVTRITKRCKQQHACENNVKQNTMPSGPSTQCNSGTENSVCHCCCFTDECNHLDGCIGTPVTDILPTLAPDRRSGDKCETPSPIENGKFDCIGGNIIGGFCSYTCNPGFELVGEIITTCLPAGALGSIYQPFPPVCQRTTCPSNTTISSGAVRGNCSDEDNIGSVCEISCEESYFQVDELSIICQENGLWSDSTGYCLEKTCRVRKPQGLLFTSCSDDNDLNSTCTFSCPAEYVLIGALTSVCRDVGTPIAKWSSPMPKCKLNKCKRRPVAPKHGIIQCMGDDTIGDKCRFSCIKGYRLIGQKSTTCMDLGNDGVKYVPFSATCVEVKCEPVKPEDPFMGTITSCREGNFYQSTCVASCNAGYHAIGYLTSECQETGKWSEFSGYCKEVLCNDIKTPAFGARACTFGAIHKQGQVCEFRCSKNHILVGDKRITCMYNDNSVGRWTNVPPTCKRVECEPLEAPSNSRIKCKRDFKVGSVCTYSCDFGYWLGGGNAQRTCSLHDTIPKTGVWKGKEPFCAPITCRNAPKYLEFGTVSCNGDKVGNICNFKCSAGYTMIGKRNSICKNSGSKQYGAWSESVPTCKALQCNEPGILKHGEISCSNDTDVNSVCEYKCLDDGFYLYPPNSIQSTCQNNLKWSVAKPCCAKTCPPHAFMDLLLLIDSSSSITLPNWNKMIDFLIGFISEFDLSLDSSRFAFARYNSEVDVESQVNLGQIRTNEEFIEHLRNVPYDGSGTRTGKAITYAATIFDSPENRDDSHDMILLVTDGQPQDDAVFAAEYFRAVANKGMIKVLPIKPTGPYDEEALLGEITQIAGGEENVIMDAWENGFDDLNVKLAKKIGDVVCGDPCYHANM